MAGLAAYLKPFGTPADILGAQTASESTRNIAAAKEELKMTSEAEKAYAKIKAAQAKAKGKKDFKPSDVKALYDSTLNNLLSGIQVSDGGIVSLKGNILFEEMAKGKQDNIRKQLADVYAQASEYADRGAKLGRIHGFMVKKIDSIKKQHKLN